MNCTHCGSYITPENRFCPNCGMAAPLPAPEPVRPAGSLPKPGLGMATAQMLVAIFSIWIVKAILNGLAFIRTFNIPQINLPVTMLVDALAAIVIIVILVRYARTVALFWPQRFPAYPQMGAPLAAVIYLIAISQLYQGAEGLINFFFVDELVLTIVKAVLLIATLVIIVRAAQVTYKYLPVWIYKVVNGSKDPD
jgi:hypothetical protein